MLVFLLSKVWGWRAAVFQLSGCYCRLEELKKGLKEEIQQATVVVIVSRNSNGNQKGVSFAKPGCHRSNALKRGGDGWRRQQASSEVCSFVANVHASPQKICGVTAQAFSDACREKDPVTCVETNCVVLPRLHLKQYLGLGLYLCKSMRF